MLHGLTKIQQKVVRDLKNPNFHIEVITDFRYMTEEFTMADDKLNSYYSIRKRTFFVLFFKKKLLKKIESVGSLQIERTKFKLK